MRENRGDISVDLWSLLYMGLWDWKGEDKPLNQATRAMRHSSCMTVELLNALSATNNKVGSCWQVA